MTPLPFIPFTYDELRAFKGSYPRVHGNGFIQLDTPVDAVRLHFWGHPDIPRQSRSTQIHNHTFGFKSTILKGWLANVTYEPVLSPFGLYDMYRAVDRKGEDTVLEFTGQRVDLECWGVTHVGIGCTSEEYSMVPTLFHETVVGAPTITRMVKTIKIPGDRNVLVLHNDAPDNRFYRDVFDVEYLWRIIKEIMDD